MLDDIWDRVRQFGFDVVHRVVAAADRLDRQEWLIVLAVVVGVGFLCLRGFGSRTNY
jgi:hypothetical protein